MELCKTGNIEWVYEINVKKSETYYKIYKPRFDESLCEI